MKNTCNRQDILKIEHLSDLLDKQKIYNQLNLASYLKECKKLMKDILYSKIQVGSEEITFATWNFLLLKTGFSDFIIF